ncbi:hypothetical protein G6R40_14350 [Chryseobacterium sp. POL2]|uniref:hypothetical protein n=1 Tax=Chryseobacterium sp. POL2 TaxID=2713414 RepID=UPI0013E17804|nr:hypothetical protein [Chryseobacterium sp. POL2]QIG90753.1 hypothetical protein G6R40_14350 [Chryseobacterium sp. POL2]
MKNLYIFLLLLFYVSINAQVFKKISNSKIDAERLELAKEFSALFFAKCEKQDYTEFKDYKMSVTLAKKLTEDNIKKTCESTSRSSGKITISDLKTVYDFKYTRIYDPIDYFVFNILTENPNSNYKYAIVSIYHDQNIIDGVYLSDRLPSEKKKK